MPIFAKSTLKIWHLPFRIRVSPKSLFGEVRQGFREYQCSPRDIFRGRVLVWPMAVPVAARNEQHRNRRDACDEKRVMISAANHGKKVQLMLAACLRKSFDYRGITLGRRVGVQQLTVD